MTDLLADVIVYPDGFVQVLDIDELCDAKEKELITQEEFFLAVKQLGELLDIIYGGHLEEFAKPLLDAIHIS
jgi:predicted RNA-binding protein associated with RNAse of E/G family